MWRTILTKTSRSAALQVLPRRAVGAVRASSLTPAPVSAGSCPHFSTSASIARHPNTSSAWQELRPVTYDELKPLTESPSDDVLLIDVREPDEVALGNIPSSVNVPLSTFEKSLNMDEGDFTRQHGFHKPTKKQHIIFYCRSGKRSTTATDLAKRAGFTHVRNYEGSWLDWDKHQK